MKKLLAAGILLGAMVLLVSPVSAQNLWRVNAQGEITLNGQLFQIKGGSWFGLEGREEPVMVDPNNPRGALMEQYIGNPWWAESGRTYDQIITEIKQMGFNTVRLPLVPQTLDAS